MRRIVLALALIALPAGAEVPADRMAWWKAKDHVLDVAGMRPLEPVGGAPRMLRRGPTIVSPALDALAAETRTQALLVWHHGRLRYERYAPGTKAATLSSPASMMKPVLALAIGAAVGAGKMALDDPASRWLPEWREDARGRITVRQLLQMTSGLAKDGPTTEGGRGAELMLGTNIDAIALATPLTGTPGVTFDYNNVNSQVLRLMLERATGRRYADWLSETIWRPIGANDGAVWLDRPGGAARGYGGLVATPESWVRVGLLVKDRGRVGPRQVVPGAWVDAMTAPSRRNANFGMHLWRASPFNATRGYGSGKAPPVKTAVPFVAGDTVFFDGGGGQRVYISRAQDLVIVRIGATLWDWDDSTLPNLVSAAF
jgi:CubicO group peptidase (beta-lactamase class C family)